MKYQNSKILIKTFNFKFLTFDSERQRGYIALITILIISAIVLIVAVSTNLLSISESDMGFEKNQSAESYYLANACAEEALQKIKDSSLFGGSGSLSFPTGGCTFIVTKLTGSKRLITALGTVGGLRRKIKITIDKIKPRINITSWQEVADF